MAKGSREKIERNQLIVELRDKPLKKGEARLTFAEIGKECRPKISAQRAHQLYVREKQKV